VSPLLRRKDNNSKRLFSRTLVYHAGLVLVLSLKVSRTSLPRSLNLVRRFRPEQRSLEASIHVLSACAPHNPWARQFHSVLNHYHQLLETCEETGAAGTCQANDHDGLTAADRWSPAPLSATDFATTATNSTYSSWPISSEGLSMAFSHSQPASNDPCPAPAMNIPFNTNMPPQTATNYSQPSVPNPAWGWCDWANTSLSGGSTHPVEDDSMWKSNPYLRDYCFRSSFAQS
jgi:hypothetical protein